MRIIDQKGRLFGKINLFDLFVLLLLITVAFFVFNRYIDKRVISTVASREITFKLFVNNVRNVTTDAIQVGDKLRHSETGQMVGELIEKEIMPSRKHVTTEDGTIVNAEIPERYDMFLTVKAEGIVTDKEITVGSGAIRLGTELKVRTNRYGITTTVFDIKYGE